MILRTAGRSEQSGERGIGLSKRKKKSLSVKLFGGALLSLFAAALVFILIFTLGNFMLDRTVYGHRFAVNMANRSFERLQDYVNRQNISKQNLRLLNPWCSNYDNTYLVLFLDDQLIFESSQGQNSDTDEEELDLDPENKDFQFDLVLTDGTVAKAFLYYFSNDAFYVWMSTIAGIIAFVVFSACFITLVHHKLRYIQKIKQDLDILASGKLEYRVRVQGNDELGELAMGIDRMRQSILQHRKSEDEMREANSELVTAMSHDLRTPLTSLLLYLEMLDRDKVSDEEQKKHLIHQSFSKAQSIKDMADKLFEYILVYNSVWEQPELEWMDADDVFRQFWQEYAFSLENHGFTVKTEFEELSGGINVKLTFLRRAFDNLYANLLKYADPEKPIEILCSREGNEACLRITNAVKAQRNPVTSTNIGLNTCQRILSMHNGRFQSEETGDRFVVELALPLSDRKPGAKTSNKLISSANRSVLSSWL